MITVNGEKKNADGQTVEEYLLQTNYSRSRIAVEINGEIVPKSQYESTAFYDGDTVEIVGFVGGG